MAHCRVLKWLALLALGCGSPSSAPIETSGSAQPREDDPLRTTALAINGHVVVLSKRIGLLEYGVIVDRARTLAGVISAEPFLFSEATALTPAAPEPIHITIKGVEPSGAITRAAGSMVKQGAFALAAPETSPPAIVLGDALATTLAVGPGDEITVTLKPLPAAVDDASARPYVFRVTGVIHTGIEQYDRELAFASRAVHQDMIGRGDSPMGIEIRVADYHRSAGVARELAAALGDQYEVLDWRTLNPELSK